MEYTYRPVGSHSMSKMEFFEVVLVRYIPRGSVSSVGAELYDRIRV